MLDTSSHTSASSNIAQSQYARRTRDLIALMTDLRALGAQADFDLPRIAVIGNQSAGKSSLVEAISGITVPRASGTCTRCPMECRIAHSTEPWQCQVLLRRETDIDGKKVAAREESFGPMLYDKSELEEMLRRAQLAILNPSLPAAFFVDFDTSSLGPGETPPGSERQFQFSESVVCLDLSGPELTDLSFIDLPGIISNVAAGDDRGNIDAVRNMVAKHIEGNTLILLTITMRDDIDNQGAAHLARLADEDGLRTIGVLTKPDTIQHGEENGWLRVLEGSSHPLKHGYYITKQPSPQELDEGISFQTARQREQTFFHDTAPWCHKTDLHQRMGTPHLTKALSKLLGGVINQALPILRRDVKNSLQAVHDELSALPPPPPANPASELLALVTGFAADVGALVDGAKGREALLQLCRPAYKRFKYDIRSTAPRFVPFKKGEETGKWQAVVLEAEGEPQEEQGEVEEMNLDGVREHIEKSLTRELPYNVPFSAKVALIQRFFASWDTHSTTCFGAVHAAALSELRVLVRTHFARYGAAALRDHVDMLVEGVVERCREETAGRIAWALELEDPPFTNNDHYFAGYREKYMTRYKDARKEIRKEGMPENANLNEVLGALAIFGFEGLKEEDLGRLCGADAHEEELTVMAETAAYFHVAYKRIIDNIPRIIDHDFLRAIRSSVQRELITGLGLGDDSAGDRARAYLAEDDSVAARRVQLEQKRARLEGVQQRLYQFGS